MSAYEGMETAQFENLNVLRHYPFAEESSLVDRIGRELSRDVVVDVHLVVPHGIGNPASGFSGESLPSVRMSSVHLSKSMVSACFVSEISGRRTAVSVTVAASNFVPFAPYRLEKLAGSEDIGGIVTFGNIEFSGFPESYFFDSAIVYPGCVSVARPASLRRFFDTRSGERVAGDVGIGFSGHINTQRDGKSVLLSLKSGSDLELASDCIDAMGKNPCGATPIKTINGIRPDEYGNIVLWFH